MTSAACMVSVDGAPISVCRGADGGLDVDGKVRVCTCSESHLIGRGMQSVRDFVLHTHGEAAIRVAKSFASLSGQPAERIEAIAFSGHPRRAGELRKGSRLLVFRALSKGLAIRLVEKDP